MISSNSLQGVYPYIREPLVKATLSDFSDRLNSPLSWVKIKPGDVFTFPEEESAVRVYTSRYRQTDIQIRYVIVLKDGENYYFPIGYLYHEKRDINGNIVPNKYSSIAVDTSSDAEIIKKLIGHSIRCVEGTEYKGYRLDEVWKNHEKSGVIDRFKNEFIVITPSQPKWYKPDTVSIPEASDDYKAFVSHLYGFLFLPSDCMKGYLKEHYSINDSDTLCLILDKGFSIDEYGSLVAPIAYKNSNGEYTIVRELQIGLPPIALLERKLDIKNNHAVVGLRGIRTISTLKRLLQSEKIILEVIDVTIYYSFCCFNPVRISEAKIIDDIGDLSFPDRTLRPPLKKMPNSPRIIDGSYSLVGVNYRAPYSNPKGKSCILYAQIDNPHDDYAIEVLRWFPHNISTFSEVNVFPARGWTNFHHCGFPEGLYELGYISRQENRELHDFMIQNDCWLLFGDIDSYGHITIKGGIEQFSEGSLRGIALPRCIFDYMYDYYQD